MSDTDTLERLNDVLELAALLRPAWPSISAGIRDSGAPTCEGDDDTGDDDQEADDAAGDDGKDWKAEAEKWKAHARKHEAKAKQNAGAADELAQLKDADKTEIQRATDKAAQESKRADAAEARLTRIEVALDKAPEGMALAKVRKLAGRLTGDSREDLEADADELFADFVPDTGDDDESGNDGGSDDEKRRRPTERLRPGAVPDAEPDETNPDKLAAQVPRMY